MKPHRQHQERHSSILWPILVAAALWAALAFAMLRPAHAAGLLIADGGFGGVLEIKEQAVEVTVNNGMAVTTVTQVFKNTENRQVEALYTFPVPKGASVANFSMWINGKEMVGEVVEKERARQIYESYKRKRRDPGLLEQVDYKTFEMRIFPIAAGAEQRVQITYYQELDYDHDTGIYVYPLSTVTREGLDSRTTGRFALNVDIKSEVPITSLESPSHGNEFVVARHDNTYYQASLEATGGNLNRDVVLIYKMSRPRTGIDLIASKERGEDGYFLLTLTAGEELKKLDRGMDYVFVLDVSGSMGNGGKLSVSQDSLEAFIAELGEDDRFEVMSFNVVPSTLFGSLSAVNDKSRAEAVRFLGSQEARGGTNLTPAMATAYKYADPDRVLNVIVLSDGMTEQRERGALMQLIGQRPRGSRVFCIGVGNEVERPLLEQLANDTGGLASFISRGDDFTRQARAFRRKLMRPAATDIELSFGSVRVYDLEPLKVPNLYHGSPVRIYGRYAGGGKATVRVRANVMGRIVEQSAELQFPRTEAESPELERMWALKRVDRLLKESDRSGNRNMVVDEVIRLGEGYSIVTEYTSFLVLENDAEYKRWKIDRRNELRLRRDRKAQAARASELETIRRKAVTDIGPAVGPKSQAKAPQVRKQQVDQTVSARPVNASKPRSRGVDFDFGSGPVGPFFAAGAYWLARRRRKKR